MPLDVLLENLVDFVLLLVVEVEATGLNDSVVGPCRDVFSVKYD